MEDSMGGNERYLSSMKHFRVSQHATAVRFYASPVTPERAKAPWPCNSAPQPRLLNSSVVHGTFHVGLVSAQLCRIRRDADKWVPVVRQCMDKMKAWSEASPWNYGHMMQLLGAEEAYCKGNHEKAKSAYEKAIHFAREHKFIHDQALCLERAALYYAEMAETCGGTSELSMKYMAEAKKAYTEWGALGKASAIAM